MAATKNDRKGREVLAGTLFVVSAPSGAGKTTLCRKLLKKDKRLRLSVSYTTRQPRKGERNNIDYTFVTKPLFIKMIERGEFAEWAVVHGNHYGTSVKRLRQLTGAGHDILLDIDIRGALQIRKNYENAVFIFILPPSLKVLKERLLGRGTDLRDVIAERLDNAKAEIAYYKDYDYVIINDSLDRAFRDLESVVLSMRLRASMISESWVRTSFNMRK
ncbi:MAG: guanylate kinase [Nitrospiraceae bacterium]|nr:MAG: guanylate kinase [Nitrospiraceae bacterium]